METRAKFVAIGAFIVAAIAIVFVFLYWLGVTSDSSMRVNVRVVFPGPVTGLKTGGLVFFNGIKVGDVGEISFDPEDPKRVVAIAKVDPATPLRMDTHVALGVSLLSQIAQIEFTGGTAQSPKLLVDGETPTLFAESSAVENLVRGAQQLVQRADNVMTDLEKLMDTNEENIGQTVANVLTFTDALAQNSNGVALFMSQLADAAGSFTGLATRLDSLIVTTEKLVKAINPEGIEDVIDNVNDLTLAFVDSTDLINELISNANITAKEIDSIASQLNKSLQSMDKLLENVDPLLISRTLQNIDRISASVADRSTEIAEIVHHTHQFTTNASQFTNDLGGAAEQINKILTRVNSMVEADGDGLVLQATRAAVSIAKVAQALEQQVIPISENLQRFSDSGLKKLTILLEDTSRTMNNLNRAITNFDRDPNRIIFGASDMPVYEENR